MDVPPCTQHEALHKHWDLIVPFLAAPTGSRQLSLKQHKEVCASSSWTVPVESFKYKTPPHHSVFAFQRHPLGVGKHFSSERQIGSLLGSSGLFPTFLFYFLKTFKMVKITLSALSVQK